MGKHERKRGSEHKVNGKKGLRIFVYLVVVAVYRRIKVSRPESEKVTCLDVMAR